MASQYRRRSLMLNTIAKVAQGNPTIITDSSSRRLKRLDVYGQSEQASTTGINILDYPKKKVVDSQYYDVDESGYVVQLISDNRPNNTLPEIQKLTAGQYTAIIESYEDGTVFQLYDLTNDKELKTMSTPSNTFARFTLDEETSISFKVYRTDGKTGKLRVQIHNGSEIKPWEPYTGGKPSPSPDYPQEIISKEVNEIKVTGKNLANIQEFEKVYDGKTFEAHYEDDKITYSGADDRSGCSIVLNQTFEAGQYTIHAKGVVMIISDIALPNFEYNEYWNGKGYPYFYKFTQLNQKISFNSDVPFKIGFIGGDINTEKSTVSGTIEQIQIELSSEATSYEKHKEQKITLTEPITLRGILNSSGGNVTIDGKKYISDVICDKDGVVGVDRNIGKLVFDGSDDEIWSVNSTDLTTCIRCEIYPARNTPYPDLLIATGMFDKLKFLAAYRDDSEHGYCQSGIFIFIDKSRLSSLDVDGLKAFLKSNSITTIFKVENPTFEPLPEEVQAQIKALKSYYPNTVIQTGCWNEVTYSAKRGG